MNWVLVLIVWSTSGDVDGGTFKVVGSRQECWATARQDTPRVRHLYAGKRFAWQCVDGSAAEKAEPAKPT